VARYKNAPLKYVIFVAELGSVSVLSERAALDAIHAALKQDVPVREDLSGAAFALADGTLSPASGARFVDGAQHRAVVVAPSRISVDTTMYRTFSEFADFLERVVGAVAEVAPGRACRRLGLRYIDEIRVPNARRGDVAQWREWIDESLFAPVVERQSQGERDISGAVDEKREDGFGVRFTWHTGFGHVVNPEGPLIVPEPSEPSPYFAFDTDSYWAARPGAEILGLGDPALLERIRVLHEPVQEYFEMSLTDRLRNEILKPVRT
jgi:uncharacterized protein (TIGR04255 family)